jgi:hypothetical protein
LLLRLKHRASTAFIRTKPPPAGAIKLLIKAVEMLALMSKQYFADAEKNLFSFFDPLGLLLYKIGMNRSPKGSMNTPLPL